MKQKSLAQNVSNLIAATLLIRQCPLAPFALSLSKGCPGFDRLSPNGKICNEQSRLTTTGLASSADVRVMISAGFHGVYAELAPAFERASGHRLITTRGPSMGDSSEAIPTRLARGEAADVVILDRVSVAPLITQGLVRADSRVDLVRSQIGMVVRAGAAKPDISSVDAFSRWQS